MGTTPESKYPVEVRRLWGAFHLQRGHSNVFIMAWISLAAASRLTTLRQVYFSPIRIFGLILRATALLVVRTSCLGEVPLILWTRR